MEKNITRLHNWYIEQEEPVDGQSVYRAHGNVTNHEYMRDTSYIRTSGIVFAILDEEEEEVVIHSRNTEYRCRISECDFSEPDTYLYFPELLSYKEKYDKEKEYSVENNSVLLVLSNHENYYFETAFAKVEGVVYNALIWTHTGKFQDSCLISFEECPKEIDIRFFPHKAHLESYSWKTDGLPVYMENAGESVIYFTTPEGVMELKPGERKIVEKEYMVEDEKILNLDKEDLYPAQEIEEYVIYEQPVE